MRATRVLRTALRARVLGALLPLLPLPAVAQSGGPAVPPTPEVRFTVSRFVVEGDNPLPEQATQAALARYAGEYSGLDGLLAAADALEQALVEAGHTFHRVSLPPQTLDGGQVTLKVVQFRLGKVHVEGNRHFGADRVVASVPTLVPGTAPNTTDIARSVAVANRHPAREVTVNLRQGEAPDAVDAVMRVQDRRPWTVFALLNNTGSPDTGRSRVSLGAQHADLFGLDHVLTASATSSPQDFSGVRQYGVSYQLPLYALSGWLSLSWVRSDVDIGQVAQIADISGSGTFWSATFRQELPRRGALRLAWSVSVQDRDFDNKVNFLPPLSVAGGNQVRSRPLALRLDGEHVRKGGSARAYVAFAHNLPGGGHNHERAYAAARAGAKRSWNALRFGASAAQALGGSWEARARIDGQWAGETLIPGEQFGLGGATSVRGFEERAVAGDNGVAASLEVWTPAIRPLAGLRLLGFVDAGIKDLERPAAGEEARDTLLSAGVGARWQWKDSLSASLDYARVLDQARGASSDAGNSRWHLSVLYRY